MLLRDPVHGLVGFETEEEAIVPFLMQAPEVQRLRRIRQLGLTCLAFVGAVHTRFAHAVGAAHVMQLLVARLRKQHEVLPFWQRLTSERARDALAASFLHDLGHGPFSHLFEEAVMHAESGIGRALQSAGAPRTPGARTHEDWTEQILLDPATGVHRLLAATDPEMPKRVAKLVRGEHELPYLARAVSGTFDVDRCDYLLRDARATGVRFGEYDLSWLLRTLRFGQGDERSAPGLAFDGTKGLSAIESFILARLFMFQQVYFHKATRAAEWMIRAILSRAMSLLGDGTPLARVPGAVRAMANGETPTVGEYLELDDHVLFEAMNAWRDAPDPVLADLCERFRARALFKTIELYGEAATPARRHEAAELLRAIAAEHGLDPDLYAGVDLACDTPYSDDSSLSVIFGDERGAGRARRPAEVSFLLDRLRDETITRVRLIFAPELRDRVRQAMVS
jgi:HD superfamily phosphohydrolase